MGFRHGGLLNKIQIEHRSKRGLYVELFVNFYLVSKELEYPVVLHLVGRDRSELVVKHCPLSIELALAFLGPVLAAKLRLLFAVGFFAE